MRTPGTTIAALLCFATAAAGQQPGTPPAPSPEQAARLNTLLDAWEAKMQGITSYYSECTHSTKDATFGSTRTMQGSVRFAREQGLTKARLELADPKDKTDWERWICTGQKLYEYDPTNKLIRYFELQNQDGQVQNETFLDLLFGMKATVAKERYTLSLVKEDEWFIYVNIHPKVAADKSQFTKAQMVFCGGKFAENVRMMPYRLWFQAPNGDQETWEFKKSIPNAKLGAADFVPPPKPEGWTVVKGNPPQPPVNEPPPGAPKVIQPNDK